MPYPRYGQSSYDQQTLWLWDPASPIDTMTLLLTGYMTELFISMPVFFSAVNGVNGKAHFISI